MIYRTYNSKTSYVLPLSLCGLILLSLVACGGGSSNSSSTPLPFEDVAVSASLFEEEDGDFEPDDGMVPTVDLPSNAGSLAHTVTALDSSDIQAVAFNESANTVTVTISDPSASGGARMITTAADSGAELSRIRGTSFYFRDRENDDEEVIVGEVIYIPNPDSAPDVAFARILYVVQIGDDGQENVFTQVSGTRPVTRLLPSGFVEYAGFYFSNLSADVVISSFSEAQLDMIESVGSGIVDRTDSTYSENVFQGALSIPITARANFAASASNGVAPGRVTIGTLDSDYVGDGFRLRLIGQAEIDTNERTIDGTFNDISLRIERRTIDSIGSTGSNDIDGAFFGTTGQVLAGNAEWAISTTDISRNDVASLIGDDISPRDIPRSGRMLRVRGSGAFFLENRE
jgi:hypothetical protein